MCVEKSSSRSRRQLDQSKQSPWKTSECNFQSIVVAALQQHTPAHTHPHTYTHIHTCGHIELLLRALRRNQVPGGGGGARQREEGECVANKMHITRLINYELRVTAAQQNNLQLCRMAATPTTALVTQTVHECGCGCVWEHVVLRMSLTSSCRGQT